MQQDKPDDYVIATGKTHTVREFCEKAFQEAGLTLTWVGEGVDEKGLDSDSERVLVEIDRQYFRPTEVDLLLGDPSKAKLKLGWEPKVGLDELIKMMVEADMQEAEHEAMCRREGYAYNGCRRQNLYSRP